MLSSWPWWSRALVVATAAAMPLVSVGCFPTDRGPTPPEQQMYFPTGVVVSPGGQALYVVNSDFDLQYKAGTVQALDLGRIRDAVPRLWDVGPGKQFKDFAQACAAQHLGVNDVPDAVLYPGSCTPVDLLAPQHDGKGPLVKTTVNIGAFAADATLALRPCVDPSKGCAKGARLLVPVRGDPSLTWIDVDDDRPDANGVAGTQSFTLACGQGTGTAARCADDHRAGMDPAENTRSSVMPGEPFAIAVSEDTAAIVVTHQTSGAASLFVHGWGDDPLPGDCAKRPSRPVLEFVLGGLPTGATGIVAFPRPLLSETRTTQSYAYQPAFLTSFRTSAEVDVLRLYDDCAAAPDRPFLSRAAAIGITANAAGFDSRSVAIDTRARTAAETACVTKNPGACPVECASEACKAACQKLESCLIEASGAPVGAYLANRSPPSLLVGKTVASVSPYGTNDSVYFYDSIALSQGPSHVYMGQVIGHDGKLHPRVFIVCFDARLIYVFDPDARAIEASITVGRGPTAMAFDPLIERSTDAVPTSFAYVAQFTDSYVGVLDLDMRHASTYLTLVATIGTPVPPREAKLPALGYGDSTWSAFLR